MRPGRQELLFADWPKKRARKGPVEENGQRVQALSILRGAMKYIHTSARKYIAGIMVNNTA